MIDLYDYLYDIRNSLASKNKVGGRGGGGGEQTKIGIFAVMNFFCL